MRFLALAMFMLTFMNGYGHLRRGKGIKRVEAGYNFAYEAKG